MSETAIPSAFFTSRLTEAFDYVRILHGSQVRKGTTIPYLAHLLAVTALVIEHGGDEDQAVAALLHDTIEDQGRTRAEITATFGDRVAQIVDGCTDAHTHPKPPWRERKKAYLAHLAKAPADVQLVAAADKLHNVRAILTDYRRLGEQLWNRFNAGAVDQIWYHRGVVTALREADAGDIAQVRSLVNALDTVVTDLEREVAPALAASAHA